MPRDPMTARLPTAEEIAKYVVLVLRIGLVIQAAVSVRRDPDDVLLSPGGGRVSLAGR
jgi:hypothetical protein